MQWLEAFSALWPVLVFMGSVSTAVVGYIIRMDFRGRRLEESLTGLTKLTEAVGALERGQLEQEAEMHQIDSRLVHAEQVSAERRLVALEQLTDRLASSDLDGLRRDLHDLRNEMRQLNDRLNTAFYTLAQLKGRFPGDPPTNI